MRSTFGWDSNLNSTNSSGFSGLPAGETTLNSFSAFGMRAAWWAMQKNTLGILVPLHIFVLFNIVAVKLTGQPIIKHIVGQSAASKMNKT